VRGSTGKTAVNSVMSNKKTESLNRAIQTAAELFSERPFEDVQIAEIAARAHCSSATIYEAFETKKGLFRAALLHNTGAKWPELTREHAPTTLFPLMNASRACPGRGCTTSGAL
jgi:AcrR family transcriptional regulator